ncbi:hypothetical protein D8674_019167 [Pyrus ussuriensis x Pyrus communis]|uniref:Uncharacterized protein n=1 Tax=Pyrus ussuriensis x Pyrus communis TaxID=2448454 RepID=A0A5N5G6T6_9ROSA|nr:hypothetical protein D8674_019167 [Pyrus ussuriensis x Pyrus communis]
MARVHDLQRQSHPLIRHRFPIRRRKLPMIRLGGPNPRRGVLFARMLKKIRLRWLKLHSLCILKKLKESYRNKVKDLMEAGASLETFHQRVFMESTLAIPMGVSLSSYPYVAGSDRPRTLFM